MAEWHNINTASKKHDGAILGIGQRRRSNNEQLFQVKKPFHITTNIINKEIHFEEISGVGACGLKEVFF
jgi:hypothetical protein